MENGHKIRRVVTGHDAGGQSVIVFNDEHGLQAAGADLDNGGLSGGQLWRVADAAQRETRLEAPTQGSMFWLVELPGERHGAGGSAESAERLTAEGAVTHREAPGMHTTRTIDYMVL